jgi:hypothetical protein
VWEVGQRVEVTITKLDSSGRHLKPPRVLPGTVVEVLPKAASPRILLDEATEPRFFPPADITPAVSSNGSAA